MIIKANGATPEKNTFKIAILGANSFNLDSFAKQSNDIIVSEELFALDRGENSSVKTPGKLIL